MGITVKLGISCCLLLLTACATAPKSVEPTTVGKVDTLTANGVTPSDMESLVALSMVCVEQEYPNYYDVIKLNSRPRSLEPSFYGCYDWHSAVHAHWAMLRFLRLFPESPFREKIVDKINTHLEPGSLQQELKNFANLKKYERPYGLSWFLQLHQELQSSSLPQAKKWLGDLKPLQKAILDEVFVYFRELKEPVRKGQHPNTAFSMALDLDYAHFTHNHELLSLLEAKAKAFYAKDKNCSLESEPSAGDFLSPCFAEADLMRRVLNLDEFRVWFAAFLPTVSADNLQPVVPLNWKDPGTTHFIGLMFQKAWTMKNIANVLSSDDARKTVLLSAAEANELSGQRLLFDSGYSGTHWLATFAIYDFSPLFLK